MLRTAYLAGSMEHVSVEYSKGWRDYASRHLGAAYWNILDPTRRVHHNDPKQFKKIFELDLRDIAESDVILVNLNDPKLAKHGTAIEVFHANYHLRKPVIAFKNDAQIKHPFFENLVTSWTATVEEAVDLLIAEYN